MSAEQLKIAVKALEDVSAWTFGWDGDCGVTRCADEALSAIEAIAPPVAAGSVDNPRLQQLMMRLNLSAGCDGIAQAKKELITDIDAWGAQQREEGKQEALDLTVSVGQLRQRAEKAEANYKIVCEKNDILRAYAEAAQSKEEQWQGKAEDALARVKELEAEDLAMHRKLAAETLRADQGWARYEAANRAKNDLERERGHKQAIIDRLMLEYCPDEMTPAQVKDWGEHQVRAEVMHHPV